MLVSTETILGADPPRSAYLESYRVLRTSLLALQEKTPFRTVLITSPGQGEGKSTISINVCTMLGLTERRTVIVDCDFYGSGLSGVLGLVDREGASDLDSRNPRPQDLVVNTEVPALGFLPSGTAVDKGPELIATGTMGRALDQLKEDAEFVWCDCTPVSGFGTALALARVVDIVFLVALARSPAVQVQRCLSLLGELGASIGGVIVNDVLPGDSAVYRSYHRYYT